MKLRAFIKKSVLGRLVSAKKKIAAKGGRVVSVKTIKLERLKLSSPRTLAETKRAYSEGRIAEMTPRQAGL